MKKQVFELLSALCVYNAEGYSRALEALEHYKSFKTERYKFSVVVEELKTSKSNEYRWRGLWSATKLCCECSCWEQSQLYTLFQFLSTRIKYYRKINWICWSQTIWPFLMVSCDPSSLNQSSISRTVLLAFVNCLIISTPQLKDRNRLRNEFIGKTKNIWSIPSVNY